MAATTRNASTGNPLVDGLLSSNRWSADSLTYSFPVATSAYGSDYGNDETRSGFEALNYQQQAGVRAALHNVATVTNLDFIAASPATAGAADLRFAQSDVPDTAWSYLPTSRAEGGDAWFNNSRGYYDAPARGDYAYATLVHELGHALGLKHPHEASGSFPSLPTTFDSLEYTVMSYRSFQGAATGYSNEAYGFPQSLMMLDIAALQTMYGADYSTNGGDTTYRWSPTTGEMSINGVGQGAPGANKLLLTVWDGGGNDTYDFSAYSNDLSVDLNPGGWTTTTAAQLARLSPSGSILAEGNVANAMLFNYDQRSLIENAVGGRGNDTIVGNGGNNRLEGGAGNDTLLGGAGNDVLVGGTGSNFLYGDAGDDTAVFEFSIHQASMNYAEAAMQLSGPQGQDALSFVERLHFSDGQVLQEDGVSVVDDMFYFTRNGDVFDARVDAEQHYDELGWREARDPNAFFDTSAYLSAYGDVADAGVNPLEHYMQWGWREGRDPSINFDSAGYLALNGDVNAAGINPLEHYLRHGIYENRATVDDGHFG